MCTIIILRRTHHDWPLIIAANRDEMKNRPFLAPARHWPERSHVVAGKDIEAGGTWLALNNDGVVSAVLNRKNSLGPEVGKRSRGELPLEATEHAEARVAANALALLEPASYRAFNLIIADATKAFWLRSNSVRIDKTPVPEGLSMITSDDLNDTKNSGRIRFHLPRFGATPTPEPDKDIWLAWEKLLASTEAEDTSNYEGALNVVTEHGFGTVSSSILAIPSPKRFGVKPIWRFCAGIPGLHPYTPIML
ncbi:MAG: hypothetical protein CMF69_05600 [Magnetovibrio sp.]|nr:hypothetical protein [Magnetovibrio sp.]|tara:strand:- start:180 stop:929 length:750 start_codon:yes stop_codon:yes gene_type:complete